MSVLLDYIIEKFSKRMLKKNKNVGTTPTSPSFKKTAVENFISAKKAYARTLKNNLSKLINGEINKSDFLSLQRTTINTAYQAAYLAGKTYTQSTETTLGDDERRSLVYHTTQEMKFLEKFADDVINNGGKMQYSRRLQMYVDGLNAVFMYGRVTYLDSNVDINWELGETDKHCIDCLTYAVKSPYKKNTLPTVPKAGNSACLSNCLCYLTYNTGTVDDSFINFIMKKYNGNGEIPTENDVKTLSAISDSFYLWRGKYELEKTQESKNLANEYRRAYNDHIKINKLAINKILPVANYINEIKKFNKKFKYIQDSNFEVGEVICRFNGNKQEYCKVKEINGNQITISNIHGVAVVVNITDTILFRLLKEK